MSNGRLPPAVERGLRPLKGGVSASGRMSVIGEKRTFDRPPLPICCATDRLEGLRADAVIVGTALCSDKSLAEQSPDQMIFGVISQIQRHSDRDAKIIVGSHWIMVHPAFYHLALDCAEFIVATGHTERVMVFYGK